MKDASPRPPLSGRARTLLALLVAMVVLMCLLSSQLLASSDRTSGSGESSGTWRASLRFPKFGNNSTASPSSSSSSSSTTTTTTLSGPDHALQSLNTAARLMEAGGVALNASQLFDFNRVRLTAYLKTAAFAERRAALRARLMNQPRRGVVIAAGGASNLANAALAVWILRRALRCSLPIEIVHFGAAERDGALVALIEAEGRPEAPVWVVDGADARFMSDGDAGGEHQRRVAPGSFASKVFALAFVTRFREVSAAANFLGVWWIFFWARCRGCLMLGVVATKQCLAPACPKNDS